MSETFAEGLNLLRIYITIYGVLIVRYVLFAGIAILLIWKVLGQRLQHRLIQKKKPERDKMIQEIKYSLSTFVIFALTGVGVYLARTSGISLMYAEIQDYGWGYFLFSVVAMIFAHDTYFYWTHRAMHHKLLFKRVHLVHHRSTNPSPWASFAFHPTEAVVEAAIVPIMIFVIPLHPFVILAFIMYMNFFNVLGHLAFELYPKGFTKSKLWGWNNTTTHHNMHHKYFNCNYGLYFNIWDKLMGTNHAKYHDTFEEVTSRQPETRSELATSQTPTLATKV
ncbi:MAG: sterol desaturase family protein [Spirochaetota bacterium]